MNKIQVEVLNPQAVEESVRMMVAAARLTQRGNKIAGLDDFKSLCLSSYSTDLERSLVSLPHPTIQKFGVINVVVCGISRRFWAQITRHQNEVKFMSASLQYSDYSGAAQFAVPYEMLVQGKSAIEAYLESCKIQLETYTNLVSSGVDNDAAGYAMPQGMRNVAIISATPYQWKHMIGQRVCRRNTSEARIVMLKIWEELYKLDPVLFSAETTGPFCCRGTCQEGRMTCGRKIDGFRMAPEDILRDDFPLLFKGGQT